jgi:transposase-like protein
VGASWQRCRVHFMPNALAKVPWAQSQMVPAAIRTIFAQADRSHVGAQLVEAAGTLRPQFRDVAAKLDDAGEDLIAFSAFPSPHWTKLWSTNPLERVNAEIKRRTNVVRSSPTTPRSCGWSARSWSNSTASGRWPSAANSPKSRWPCSRS